MFLMESIHNEERRGTRSTQLHRIRVADLAISDHRFTVGRSRASRKKRRRGDERRWPTAESLLIPRRAAHDTTVYTVQRLSYATTRTHAHTYTSELKLERESERERDTRV